MSASVNELCEQLAPWFEQWALATQNARWDKRLESSAEQITEFYNAVVPHLEAILDLADGYPMGEMPDDMTRLFDLCLMLAEIAPNVELYRGNPKVPYSFAERRFIAVRGEQQH